MSLKYLQAWEVIETETEPKDIMGERNFCQTATSVTIGLDANNHTLPAVG